MSYGCPSKNTSRAAKVAYGCPSKNPSRASKAAGTQPEELPMVWSKLCTLKIIQQRYRSDQTKWQTNQVVIKLIELCARKPKVPLGYYALVECTVKCV